jgi:hypothetical protein
MLGFIFVWLLGAGVLDRKDRIYYDGISLEQVFAAGMIRTRAGYGQAIEETAEHY